MSAILHQMESAHEGSMSTSFNTRADVEAVPGPKMLDHDRRLVGGASNARQHVWPRFGPRVSAGHGDGEWSHTSCSLTSAGPVQVFTAWLVHKISSGSSPRSTSSKT